MSLYSARSGITYDKAPTNMTIDRRDFLRTAGKAATLRADNDHLKDARRFLEPRLPHFCDVDDSILKHAARQN
jgi:hypothetical protein